MNPFNIYLIGVGGQGIGLLSETLLRAADHAGLTVKGVDTHGLAQRGGTVVSRIRLGASAHSPLIADRRADMVISLERCEALRGMNRALRDEGVLVYYDAAWQPLAVRLGEAPPVTGNMIQKEAGKRRIRVVKIFREDLADARMQNMVVLAELARQGLIPGVESDHFRQSLDDLMTGDMLERNMTLFETVYKETTERREPMTTKITYQCSKCGKTRELMPEDTVPDCCSTPMDPPEPLPVCETTATAEHSRMDDDMGPCDDGRSGQ